ncbi:stage II sporulation protein M [Anaerotignum neopropionicum]|uniref:Stage II sporulation protein M n=1 Tax=Anaerotignum neopropionicum TaxID=36847 RepID=A0A136WDE9_9FIRM|nr:stage II sporulation protein M [Anaerotignum neopropionicum]KXL52516.1 stage II sporulation protein M [Anaerotignum neopropionicum]
MVKRNKWLDKRGQKIIIIVCLSFLVGVMGGAIAANLMGPNAKSELILWMKSGAQAQQSGSFTAIFWKYLKYDIIIWLGGWLQLGLFLSGMAFLLRSISLGFASAMMMVTYGVKGVWGAMFGILPQNIILIPAYIFIMCAAIYYLLTWNDGNGKRGLKRERRRKQTEYCIIFLASIVFVAIGAGIEVALYPL